MPPLESRSAEHTPAHSRARGRRELALPRQGVTRTYEDQGPGLKSWCRRFNPVPAHHLTLLFQDLPARRVRCRPCSPLGVAARASLGRRALAVCRTGWRGGRGTRAVLVSGSCPRSAAAECSSLSSSMSRLISRCPRCRGPSCSSPRTRPRAHRFALVPRARRSRCPPRYETPVAACSSRRSKSSNGSRWPVQPSVRGAPSSVGGLGRPYDLALSSEDPH